MIKFLMADRREHCYYYLKIKPDIRLYQLMKEGMIRITDGYFCDGMTPISKELIPPGGLDMSCVGSDSEECPGFLEKEN